MYACFRTCPHNTDQITCHHSELVYQFILSSKHINIPHRKTNWIGHILRRNRLQDAIEGQMTEVKGVGRRRTQLLDDLRNRRRYWELKEEAEDQNTSRWK